MASCSGTSVIPAFVFDGQCWRGDCPQFPVFIWPDDNPTGDFHVLVGPTARAFRPMPPAAVGNWLRVDLEIPADLLRSLDWSVSDIPEVA